MCREGAAMAGAALGEQGRALQRARRALGPREAPCVELEDDSHIAERLEREFLVVELAPAREADRAPLRVVLDGEHDVLVRVAVDLALERDRHALEVAQPLRQVAAEEDGLDALDRQRLARDLARRLEDARHRPVLADVEVVDAGEVVLQLLDVRLHREHLVLHRARRVQVGQRRVRRPRQVLGGADRRDGRLRAWCGVRVCW